MFIQPAEEYKQIGKLLSENKLSEAYPRLKNLLNLFPSDPYVTLSMGSYFSKKEDWAMAMLCYERGLMLDPGVCEAWNNLAGMYRKYSLNDKARECYRKAIDLSNTPEFEKVYSEKAKKRLRCDFTANMGSTYIAVNQPEKAIEWLNKALNIDPESISAKWNLGLAHLELGHWQMGFDLYDIGDRMNEDNFRQYTDKSKLWSGQKDKTVVVYGEQGIGDEIMLASILPEVARDCRKVIFDAHPRLIKMFRRSFPEIDVYGTRKAHDCAWVANYDIDYQIPIGSLPKLYRQSDNDFEQNKKVYIKPDKKEVLEVRSMLPDGKCIGLSWKGGTQSTNKKARCVDLEMFVPFMQDMLKKDPKINFISLQYHKHTQEEVDRFNEVQRQKGTGVFLYHWQNIVDDYDLTCALLPNLDYIVSVPQSIVHLAGAMGIKTLQLCPWQHLWQMGVYGKDMPWYESVKNIWQKNDGDWQQCINDAKDLLTKELA